MLHYYEGRADYLNKYKKITYSPYVSDHTLEQVLRGSLFYLNCFCDSEIITG